MGTYPIEAGLAEDLVWGFGIFKRIQQQLGLLDERWESLLATGLKAMQNRGMLNPRANPRDLATAIISALQGRLLLAQTTRSTRPLELALDMALDHISTLAI